MTHQLLFYVSTGNLSGNIKAPFMGALIYYDYYLHVLVV